MNLLLIKDLELWFCVHVDKIVANFQAVVDALVADEAVWEGSETEHDTHRDHHQP